MKLYPMVLTPFVSETVWGGRRLIDEYSVVTDKRNAAEAWVMSAHKNGSVVVGAGVGNGDAHLIVAFLDEIQVARLFGGHVHQLDQAARALLQAAAISPMGRGAACWAI